VTSGGAGSPAPVRLRPAADADFGALVGLLESAGLPTDGLPSGLGGFFIAESGGRIVGGIGLEDYGRAALLRSAVVEPGSRGSGIGDALVRRALDHARARGMAEIFLLTTTADEYFPRFGFTRITRDEVPAAVRESFEFRVACPASATVMHTAIGGI
jgi:amino-acid N-acetyltransferase